MVRIGKQSKIKIKHQIRCKNCFHRSLIANTPLIQTYWYVPPHGCTGGDYWKAGEMQFLCHHCNHVNRLLYEQKHGEINPRLEFFQSNYRFKFKEIIETHDGERDDIFKELPWINNHWIDEQKI